MAQICGIAKLLFLRCVNSLIHSYTDSCTHVIVQIRLFVSINYILENKTLFVQHSPGRLPLYRSLHADIFYIPSKIRFFDKEFMQLLYFKLNHPHFKLFYKAAGTKLSFVDSFSSPLDNMQLITQIDNWWWDNEYELLYQWCGFLGVRKEQA